ncbi:hypothetical protein D3C86_1797710 [compost metagenome]
MLTCVRVSPTWVGVQASISVRNLRSNSAALATPMKHLNWSAFTAKSPPRFASIQGMAQLSSLLKTAVRATGSSCSSASIRGSVSGAAAPAASSNWLCAMRSTLDWMVPR